MNGEDSRENIKVKQQILRTQYGIKITCEDMHRIVTSQRAGSLPDPDKLSNKLGNSTIGAILDAWRDIEQNQNLPEDTKHKSDITRWDSKKNEAKRRKRGRDNKFDRQQLHD